VLQADSYIQVLPASFYMQAGGQQGLAHQRQARHHPAASLNKVTQDKNARGHGSKYTVSG
jgi:hypothetical protein